ncbi:hypothetical protein [Pacificibacter sp. AS14]|uniref:hypothetical protein n=1 Tax=Pacificibacter sp. AS14 TaxID=3135785 RepID=UPI0031817AEB
MPDLLVDQQAVKGALQSSQQTNPRKGKSALMSLRAGARAPSFMRFRISSKVPKEIRPSWWPLRSDTSHSGISMEPAKCMRVSKRITRSKRIVPSAKSFGKMGLDSKNRFTSAWVSNCPVAKPSKASWMMDAIGSSRTSMLPCPANRSYL